MRTGWVPYGVPVACLVVFWALVACSGADGDATVGPAEATRVVAARPPAPESLARVALREWDEARAAAYADDSATALRDLYLPGSKAGRRDVRLLRSYGDRGLTVSGMRMQVLALDVLESTEQTIRVRVTDRLVGAAVRDRFGQVRALPRDAATTRTLTLHQYDGEWRMAGVS